MELFSITEPIGSRAPTFQSELNGNMLRRATGQSFALLCQAQAFPIPLMRLVEFYELKIEFDRAY